MKGEKAVEVFKLAKQSNLLPAKIDELVPLSFIGQAAVSFYRQKIKLMDQLKMTEAQRKATLSDGQDAGEMLLDIETRIGELAKEEGRVPVSTSKDTGRFEKSGKAKKAERLGIERNRFQNAQKIAANPKIVEKVKAQAKANEDIPTKTAVLAEIRYQKEKKRREEAEGKKGGNRAIVAIDQANYINALDRCIGILPTKPPKDWSEKPFKEAVAKANIIMRRLEAFNE